jgi:hypothetical protein
VNAPADVKLRYRRFADTECQGYSDILYRLAVAVSDDDDVAAFIAAMPVTQPNLFFAAIQLLTGPDDMPQTGSELRALVDRRGNEIRDVMQWRRTQTNEVGRCAVLLPALPPGPLALVEVGASAGLCLLLERFCYQFGSTRIGEPSAPVHLRCSTTGPVPLPAAVPNVVWRRGLDASPIDVRDGDAVRWLLACVWPEHSERRQRLAHAVALARAAPVTITTGDLVDDLPAVLAEVPRDAQLVVFHSAVLSYVDAERRRAFADVLAEASKAREVVWVSNEADGIVPEMSVATHTGNELRFRLGRTHFSKGRRQDELLAVAHPHGSELAWL